MANDPGPDETPNKKTEAGRLAELEKITNEELLHRIHASGFTEDTFQLLHIVPLIQVAWADGEVTASERERILKLAQAQGLADGGPTRCALLDWLDRRPSDDFFDRALEAIRLVMLSLKPEQRTEAKKDLFSYCSSIASASGGFLGLGRISSEERAALEIIAAELERNNETAVREVIDKWQRIEEGPDLAAFP
jgi:hypothetical protein